MQRTWHQLPLTLEHLQGKVCVLSSMLQSVSSTAPPAGLVVRHKAASPQIWCPQYSRGWIRCAELRSCHRWTE